MCIASNNFGPSTNQVWSQQRAAALLTVANDVDETYDAYEKDIAIVSFSFDEEPAIFEYIRC